MRIVQISDTHLTADGLDAKGHDHLEQLLAELVHIGDFDLMVVAGDCSDDGSDASYEILRETVEPFAAARGGKVVYTPGNHDYRPSFRAVLGDGHGGPATGTKDGPINGISMVGGTRVITLDSTIPGLPSGHLDEATLSWLREQLETAAPEGTVLVVHHPPVPRVTDIFDRIQLDNPQELAAALIGSDVRVICSGHFHHFLADTVMSDGRQIPVVVSPGVMALTDLTVAPSWHREVAQFGALVLDVTVTGVRQLVISGGNGELIDELSDTQVAQLQVKFDALKAAALRG